MFRPGTKTGGGYSCLLSLSGVYVHMQNRGRITMKSWEEVASVLLEEILGFSNLAEAQDYYHSPAEIQV